ncbi:MAG: hypothetical protein JOZ12_10865, partial [Sinobacteraceae bacterium]|nr:hypothetical protein [Nevskiaceae bacterium]
HLLDAGAPAPRCVGVCPTEVFQAVKTTDEDMAERAARDGLRVLAPERLTRPRIWYRNLDRADHCFIGGTVSRTSEGVSDCVAGATAELRQNGRLVASLSTDVFGDFRFDGLVPASGEYEVRVREGGDSLSISVTLGQESIYLEEIELTTVTESAAARPLAVANA